MAQTMLWGMLIMALAAWMYSIAVSLARARTLLLQRERQTDWARAQLEAAA
jgi:heme exporter protein C